MCIDCDTVPPCPVCDGDGVPLGALGNKLFLSCRQCGTQYHADAANFNPELEDHDDD